MARHQFVIDSRLAEIGQTWSRPLRAAVVVKKTLHLESYSPEQPLKLLGATSTTTMQTYMRNAALVVTKTAPVTTTVKLKQTIVKALVVQQYTLAPDLRETRVKRADGKAGDLLHDDAIRELMRCHFMKLQNATVALPGTVQRLLPDGDAGWDPATLSWKTAPVPADLRETVSGVVAAERLRQLHDGELELPGVIDFDQRLTETRRIFYAERVVQGCAPARPAPEVVVTGSLRVAQAARAAQALEPQREMPTRAGRGTRVSGAKVRGIEKSDGEASSKRRWQTAALKSV